MNTQGRHYDILVMDDIVERQADSSPLRRALREHFEKYDGVIESKHLAEGHDVAVNEDPLYKDTSNGICV